MAPEYSEADLNTIENELLILVVNDGVQKNDTVNLHKLLKFKQLFILNEWNLEHPDSKINNYSNLENLMQRNRELQIWYQSKVGLYGSLNSMPYYVLRDVRLIEAWGGDKSEVYEKIQE
jgi:hypothetical protein